MRIRHIAAACVLFFTVSAAAQDSMPPKTLLAIKRATVFVKVEVQGLSGSGSGFVITADGENALLVTNHHVIEPKVQVEVTPKKGKRPFGSPIPPSLTPRTMVTTLKNAKVTLVFDSGTKNERSAKAEVVAIDPERDLAVLRVKDVKDLPAPIDLAKAPELVETLPVYTFGYPFGKVLATSKGSPAITIGKAAISSLRENDDGELTLVQIDGALNPGNSGGPIVDVQGRLVGVAVATIKNSSGIGLAIPGNELRHTLLGRVGTFHLASKDAGQNKTSVRVEVGVIDPLDKITAITLHYLPAKAKADAEKAKDFAGLAGCKSVRMSLEKQLAVADLSFETKDMGKELLLQAEFVNGTGKKVKTKVIRQAIKPDVVVAKSDSDPVQPPVKGAPAVYTYSQGTGKLTLDDKLVGTGYSGMGAAKNDNAKQANKDGPIPVGEYLLTGFRDDPKLGKIMGLLPVAGKVDHFGRFPGQPFAIIAESDNPPAGCFIVLPRDVFDKLSTQPLSKVQVVK